MEKANEKRLESSVDRIATRLDAYRERDLALFSTSSFQTNSTVLLHILSTLAPDVPVYFLDSGYHFPETLQFKRRLAALLGLEVRSVRASVSRLQQRDADGRLLFASDPEYCCYLNKVAPLEPVLTAHDVWISGVRAYQNSNRAAFRVEQSSPGGVLRFHPLLDWTPAMLTEYRRLHDLPRHPLDGLGYGSVGCEPCTRRVGSGARPDDRSGRWQGLTRSECGLHL